MKPPFVQLAFASMLLATASARAARPTHPMKAPVRSAAPVARSGGISDGGGNAVGHTLFDFYENEGTQKINPVDLPAYRQVLLPMLKRIEGKVSGVMPYVLEGLTAKTWYFEPKAIGSAACVNASLVSISRQIVACQTDREVRISMQWFQAADAKNQAGLLLHELFVHHTIDQIRYRNGVKSDLEASVHRLVRLFFETPEATDEAVQRELETSGFEDTFQKDFLIAADRKLLAAQIQEFIRELCPQNDRRAAERQAEFMYESSDDARSRALRNASKKWITTLEDRLADEKDGIQQACKWAAEYAQALLAP